jgi:monovalent cation:H+ antiporter-2, CPA2 family
MAASVVTPAFREALIVLGSAAIVIPVFHRVRLSPVLGFILVGVAVGPFGLGALSRHFPPLAAFTIADAAAIAPVAELGVVMLMFMIGLDLSFERLIPMRRLVFGLGSLQLIGSAVALAVIARALGETPAAAAVLGLALAMSSTAITMQVLTAAGEQGSPVGRTAFAVLLFQDLAVVPVLFAIGVLGYGPSDGEIGTLGLAVGKAVLAIAGVLGIGWLALRPLFRGVARTASPELFMAACLLVIIATGLATAAAGLSMAVGALIAGLLLAETEYRRQIEVTIEPFKGLLLGVFLISVGIGLDLGRIAADPVMVLGGAAALVAIKLVITAALARGFGLRWPTAVRTGMLLGPGGEFGFVIVGLAGSLGLIAPAPARYALILAALTMVCIPLLFSLGEALFRRLPSAAERATPEPVPDDSAPRVIIAGFGRVGETVAALLDAHAVGYVAIDSDPDRVAEVRGRGKPVYWGDITRIEMLRRLHLDSARAVVVTMTDRRAADRLVRAVRRERAELLIVARARDAVHAAHLYRVGATDAVPETIEASLQLSEAVLVDLGVPMGPVIASIHEQRAASQAEIRALAPHARIRVLGRLRLRDRRK